MPDRSISLRPRRRLVVPALLVLILGLFALFGLNSRDVLAGDRPDGADRPLPRAMLRGLSIDDLPAGLNLTPAQRSELARAIDELRADRRGAAWEARGSRDARDARRRFEGRRDARGNDRHGWRRPAPCYRDRACDGDGPHGRIGRSPMADRRPGVPRAGFEPPMVEFLDAAAEILSPDQFALLTRHLAERREEGRDDLRGRVAEQRVQQMSRHLDRRAGMLIRILNLEGTQADAVRQTYAASVSRRQAVWNDVAQGKLEAAAAFDAMRKIETEDNAAIRASLTEAQRVRFDALENLLPAGPRFGASGPGEGPRRPRAGRGGAGRPGPGGYGFRGDANPGR